MTHKYGGVIRRSTAIGAGLFALGAGPMAGAAQAAPMAVDPFQISGSVTTPLFPGSVEPLDLSLNNPNGAWLRLRTLTVTLESVTPLPTRTCAVTNFVIDQATLPGGPGLLLPGHTTTLLSTAGLTTSQLPQVRMVETGMNQDGCQGAALALRYVGTAVGADRDVPGGGGGGGGGDDHDHDHDGDHDHHGDHDHDHDSDSDDHAGGLPGTGGSGHEWLIASTGLGLLTAGLGGVGFARRRKGDRA